MYNDKIARFRIEGQSGKPEYYPLESLKIYPRFYEHKVELVEGLKRISGTDQVYTIKIKAADGEKMTCYLMEADYTGDYVRDSKDNTIKPKYHYTYSKEDDYYTFYFSSGKTTRSDSIYRAKMYVYENGKTQTALEFYFAPENGEGSKVPLVNHILYKNPYYINKLNIVSSNYDSAEQDGYLKLVIEYPEGYSVSSLIEDKTGSKYFPGTEKYYTGENRVYSYGINRRTIYFKPPTKDEYFVRIFAKKVTDKSSNTAIELFLAGSRFSAASIPPPMELILHKRFFENGFILTSSNINTKKSDEPFELVIESTEGFEVRCLLKDSEGKTVKGFYEVEKKGSLYILHYTVPDDNNRYQAKFYKYKDKKYSTIGYFYINE